MSGVPKFNFPGPIGTKRRRMRSGGGVSTLTNNAPKSSVVAGQQAPIVTLAEADDVGEEVVQTSKCKGATTIPIFLKKTYKMIDTCDPNIASWSEDGDMFVVRDPDIFAAQVIPQYFDHNKFSSFARQLNFYGFRKMQSKPIRNSDFDAGTAKHVTFYNENFKRGRCDLLKKIQRSTRGGGNQTGQDQAREIQALKDQVVSLEQKLQEQSTATEERFRRLELDMLARIEQVMMAMQQQQQAHLQLQTAASIGSVGVGGHNTSVGGVGGHNSSIGTQSSIQQQQAAQLQQLQRQQQQAQQQNWDSLASAAVARGNSLNSNNGGGVNFDRSMQPPQPQNMSRVGSNNSQGNSSGSGGPTLPPHPKMKQLPMPALPGAVNAPPDRLNSLRGISMLSRGLSNVARGTSVGSSASAILMRNSWEDKFFSMLMLDENAQNAAQNGGDVVGPTPIGPGANHLNNNNNNGSNNNGSMMPPASVGQQQPVAQVSDRSIELRGGNNMPAVSNSNLAGGGPDDLSSVSSSDMP